MRERVINRAGLWAGIPAIMAALLLVVALAPQASAQDGPFNPPFFFYGWQFNDVNGATIEALDADGGVIENARIGPSGGFDSGAWSMNISSGERLGSDIKFRITNGDEIRETATLTTPLVAGKLRQLYPRDFTIVETEPEEIEEEVDLGETIQVQVRARLAPDGRLEFGARRAGGDDVLPRGRFLSTSVVDGRITPQDSITHGRWLRSTPIDLGDGYVVRVIARVNPSDSRIEFGLYVDGVDAPIAQYNPGGTGTPMFLPRGRYFPPTTSHNRWLSSNPPTDIPKAR